MSARTAVPVFLIAVLTASCGDAKPAGPEPSGTGSPATSTSAVPVFDPPKAFADEPRTVTPDQHALVGPELAYTSMAPGQNGSGRDDPTLTIRAFSLRDGEERWKVVTPIQSGGRLRVDNDFFRLTTGPGPARLVWAGLQRTAGSGTQQDRFELVAGAVDASTGEQVWSTRKPFEREAPEKTGVRVVGADAAHAAIALVRSGEPGTGVVVDGRAGKVVDTPPGFTPVGLDGGVVVGLHADGSAGTVARGVDAASGQVRWTGDIRVDDLRAGVVTGGVAQFAEDDFFDGRTLLVGTSDGAVRAALPGSQDCSPATADVVVCVAQDRVEAVEVTGRSLWALPDKAAGRVMPHVTAVHSGLVYATAGRGVILDARTGKDVVTDLDWVPDDVVAGYGIERSQVDGLQTRRATA